jgi:hypothetical protein
MTITAWTDSDTAIAERIWSVYQREHDLSGDIGKTVGIDPKSGRVWIGNSIPDVIKQRDVCGSSALLYFERIGSQTYYRKGLRQ